MTNDGLYVQNHFQLRTVFGQNLSPTLMICDNKHKAFGTC